MGQTTRNVKIVLLKLTNMLKLSVIFKVASRNYKENKFCKEKCDPLKEEKVGDDSKAVMNCGGNEEVEANLTVMVVLLILLLIALGIGLYLKKYRATKNDFFKATYLK